MARFRYGLQNILDIKNKMETQARQEFAQARQALDEEEEKKRKLLEERIRLENQAAMLLNGKLNLRDIEDNQMSRMLCDQRIEEQTKQVKRAEAVLEAAREQLEGAVRERKIYEKLKEKAFDEFRIEENRAESKVIDELTTYVHGRKNQNDD